MIESEMVKSNPELPRTLYLRFTDESLGFARYDAGELLPFYYSNYKFRPQTSLVVNLRNAVSEEPLLAAPAISTHVLVNGPVTLVPLSEFQEEDGAKIYDHLFPTEKLHRVFYETIPSTSSVLLFSLEETICATFDSLFDRVVYHSSFTPVLRHFSRKNATLLGTSAKRVFIYGHEKGIEVAIFDENRLVMFNGFPLLRAADAAYFVFNMVHFLSEQPTVLSYYVAGNLELRDQIVSEMQKFAKNVYSLNPSAEFNRHPVTQVDSDVPYDLITYFAE